eukprot:SAG11_NODE_3970_length_2128_cov_1.975850_3_plen_111_part_00
MVLSLQGVLTEAKNREEARRSRWRSVKPIEAAYTRKEEIVLKAKGDGSSKLSKEAREAGGARIPRLRRCTVEQILAGGGGASLPDEYELFTDSEDEIDTGEVEKSSGQNS